MIDKAGVFEYRNKFLLNQRGGTIYINNSTGREQLRLSQHSGSNISITNFVNSELATNNKQTKVIQDEFRTVGGNLVESVGEDRVVRTANNHYELLGYATGKALNATMETGVYYRWREDYRVVAEWNSQFDIYRGGYAWPPGEKTETKKIGTRAKNPDLKFKAKALKNKAGSISPSPWRKFNDDQVRPYTKFIGTRFPDAAADVQPKVASIKQAFGKKGTYAWGVEKFGASKSSATEEGSWVINAEKNAQIILEVILMYAPIQDPGDRRGLEGLPRKKLLPLEARMGVGGDSIISVKRHKLENIGVIVNDYPSVRIDEYGRSQPTELGVSKERLIKHHDYVPHVEEISNDENFPCGNHTLNVGNKYTVQVGSGGVIMNSTGAMFVGCTSLRAACTRVDVNASHGIILGSSSHIDIYSPKIQIRSNKQVLIDTTVGITNNTLIGGGLYVEGELYTHHITAPLEIQETERTELWGRLPNLFPRTFCAWAHMETKKVIGVAKGTVLVWNGKRNVRRRVSFPVYGSGNWVKVYGSGYNNTVYTYPHSHHFHNLPLRLMESNEALRNHASRSGINASKYAVRSSPLRNIRKTKQKDPGRPTETTT